MRVLVTGAGGRMAWVLRPVLRERYGQLRLFDRQACEDLHSCEQLIVGDLADLDAVRAAMRGVEVVVHLGGIPSNALYTEIAASNVTGTYNVFEAAHEHGVRRVIFASSNHVTGFYPQDASIGVDAPFRPDSMYGVSKAFGELVARLYHDKWGLEVVVLRIGSFRDRPEDIRQLSTWLSHRDGTDLVVRSIEAANVGYTVIYGVSNNTRTWWTHGEESKRLGYHPNSDAEHYAAELGADTVPLERGDQPQGGAWAERNHGAYRD